MSANASGAANRAANTGKGVLNATGNAARRTAGAVANAGRQTAAAVGSLSTINKIFLTLLILILVAALIYWVIYSRMAARAAAQLSPVIIGGPVNAFDGRLASTPVTLPYSTQGMDFTYSFWMYVSDWGYKSGQPKFIFFKGNMGATSGTEDLAATPALWLDANTNNLSTGVQTYGLGPGTAPQFQRCDVANIPLQKWVHISYILQDRHVDIYVDGKLERSCVLDAVPVINADKLYIAPAGGFYGQLAGFQYFTSAISPGDIADIYAAGPYALVK